MQTQPRLSFKTFIAENLRLLGLMLKLAMRPREELDEYRYRIARDILGKPQKSTYEQQVLIQKTFSANLDHERQELVTKTLVDGLDVSSAQAALTDAAHPALRLDDARYSYQKANIHHQFHPDDKVLDVGSGNDPFPAATVLADRFIEPTHHRTTQFKTDNKPVIISDINELPFATRTFDYIMCAHVLEHVDDPIRACYELQRVGKAGFIETPTLMKDALFGWAKGMHRWHLVVQHNQLVFFEYDARRAEGVRDLTWNNIILNRSSFHPLQKLFADNQDIFNTMLEWEGRFDVTIFYLDGRIRTTRQATEVITKE